MIPLHEAWVTEASAATVTHGVDVRRDVTGFTPPVSAKRRFVVLQTCFVVYNRKQTVPVTQVITHLLLILLTASGLCSELWETDEN